MVVAAAAPIAAEAAGGVAVSEAGAAAASSTAAGGAAEVAGAGGAELATESSMSKLLALFDSPLEKFKKFMNKMSEASPALEQQLIVFKKTMMLFLLIWLKEKSLMKHKIKIFIQNLFQMCKLKFIKEEVFFRGDI